MEKFKNFLTKIINLTTAAQNAGGRNVISLLMGVVISFGLMSASKSEAVITAIINVSTQVGIIATALAAIIGAIMPLMASNSAQPAKQAESLTQAVPGTVIITPDEKIASSANPNIVHADAVSVEPKS